MRVHVQLSVSRRDAGKEIDFAAIVPEEKRALAPAHTDSQGKSKREN
eukprot:COSAG03_NODE_2429_length_2781_cov_7.819538_3_plen_47_part_00